MIRLSGPRTLQILRKILRPLPASPTPRQIHFSHILKGGRRIDRCLVTFFQGPRSYTGEDLAELSTHSNPFLIGEILELLANEGARPARAGEFTYRAFVHGKMDLLQAEAVNDLIHADSLHFARMTFSNLEGKFSRMAEELKSNLTALAVTIETQIEFSEDQHLDPVSLRQMHGKFRHTRRILDQILTNARYHGQLSRGLEVVIMGKVNVGKSTLFNALLLKERSITSPLPHTTRDYIEDSMHLEGVPIRLTDIAGIGEGEKNEVESEGIKRSYEKIRSARAVIFLLDAAGDFTREDQSLYRLTRDKETLVCLNKMDIPRPGTVRAVEQHFADSPPVKISLIRDRDLSRITGFLTRLIREKKAHLSDYSVNLRQKTILQKVHRHLTTIEESLQTRRGQEPPLEMVAEELRLALGQLGELLGEVTGEDILEDIFSRFCIGK